MVRWTKNENRRLKRAINKYGESWSDISREIFPNKRGEKAIRNHYLEVGKKKGPWTPEEDQILRNCLDARDLNNSKFPWEKISEKIIGRTAKQIRERAVNHVLRGGGCSMGQVWHGCARVKELA